MGFADILKFPKLSYQESALENGTGKYSGFHCCLKQATICVNLFQKTDEGEGIWNTDQDSAWDAHSPYQSAWVRLPTLLLIPASFLTFVWIILFHFYLKSFCLKSSWETADDGSRMWVPESHSDWVLGFWFWHGPDPTLASICGQSQWMKDLCLNFYLSNK